MTSLPAVKRSQREVPEFSQIGLNGLGTNTVLMCFVFEGIFVLYCECLIEKGGATSISDDTGYS